MCESWVLLLNLLQLLVRLDAHNVLRVSAHADQVGHTLKQANMHYPTQSKMHGDYNLPVKPQVAMPSHALPCNHQNHL